MEHRTPMPSDFDSEADFLDACDQAGMQRPPADDFNGFLRVAGPVFSPPLTPDELDNLPLEVDEQYPFQPEPWSW